MVVLNIIMQLCRVVRFGFVAVQFSISPARVKGELKGEIINNGVNL